MGLFGSDTYVGIKQDELLKRSINRADQSYDYLVSLERDSFADIWHNTQGLTPQQALAALGTNAVGFFMRHAALRQFLKSLNPAITFEDAPEFVPHPDGTVTYEPPVIPGNVDPSE